MSSDESLWDGFRPQDAQARHRTNSSASMRALSHVELLSRRLGVVIEGTENIPAQGGGLIVANHTFGWDVGFVMARVWAERRRRVWALGEHAFWRFPFLRTLAVNLGTVDGTRENVDELLSGEHLVLVLPGGLRESVKPRDLRYRLLWGHRYGFVKAAVRQQTPIIPLACVGADDLFDFVGNAYDRGRRWLRRPGIPIPLPQRLLPIPHRVRFRFVLGEPIPPPSIEQAERNPACLRRFRREVEGAIHEAIEMELAKRVGIDLR